MTQLTDTLQSASARAARAAWAAGDWDGFSGHLAPVGALVLERSALRPGMTLLDVGTGTGGNIAIPAAQRGATVIGLDITPELLAQARSRAGRAGVRVDWIEGDALDLPFGDGSFDRVISTFGAMFAPDHERTAAELVRVCAPGGRLLMTTWLDGGFAGELFELTASFLPASPSAGEPPAAWGSRRHVEEVFDAAGAEPSLARETAWLQFRSVDDAVRCYARDFGPFVLARAALEREGRWDAFLAAFEDLVFRFADTTDDGTRIAADYFVITAEC
jgi:ubiquinone/menaquinone biosynthesis C-methylase UbiE